MPQSWSPVTDVASIMLIFWNGSWALGLSEDYAEEIVTKDSSFVDVSVVLYQETGILLDSAEWLLKLLGST